jgi:hypothetical protein
LKHSVHSRRIAFTQLRRSALQHSGAADGDTCGKGRTGSVPFVMQTGHSDCSHGIVGRTMSRDRLEVTILMKCGSSFDVY